MDINAAPLAPMPGFVWISPEGQWLTYYERTTHTGTHKVFGTTTELSRAFVGFQLPKANEGVKANDYVKIPATVHVVRTVRLCTNSATPESIIRE